MKLCVQGIHLLPTHSFILKLAFLFEDNVQGNLSVGMHYVLSIIFLLLSIDRFGRWGHRQDSAEVSNGSLRHAGIIIHFTRLRMTSWRPCWWSKRKGFLSHGN